MASTGREFSTIGIISVVRSCREKKSEVNIPKSLREAQENLAGYPIEKINPKMSPPKELVVLCINLAKQGVKIAEANKICIPSRTKDKISSAEVSLNNGVFLSAADKILDALDDINAKVVII